MNIELENFLNENEIYLEVLKKVVGKYKTHGKITGSFEMKAKKEADILALRNFDPRVFELKKAKIKSCDVEKLFSQKYKDIDFIEILNFVNGKKIMTNKESKEKSELLFKEYFENILYIAEDGEGKKCFEKSLENKNILYRSIILKYNESKNNVKMLESLKKDFSNIINALNNLPVLKNKFEILPTFAAKYSKDSHYFDYGTWKGNFLVKAVQYILNLEAISDIESYNNLLLEAGICKDVISNNLTIYGFYGETINNNVKENVKAIDSFVEWQEPLQISLSNILKVDTFIPASSEVYIFENPSILAGLLDKGIKNKAIICTSGQLNLSAHIFLKKLRAYEKIYYAGDFDFKGIEIAYKLKEKLKEKLELLFYKKEFYKIIKSENKIEQSKINCLTKYKIDDLKEIIECIEIYKCAAYQELLFDQYKDFLNSK